ncbi:MAG: hypothetical protein M0R06_03020 [Sphaerochaeta sp.]|jgi:hypothetical protein|nr:hypothetical protein [Sphaerochaeta sp.]
MSVGEEVEYTSGTPQDVQTIRNNLIAMIQRDAGTASKPGTATKIGAQKLTQDLNPNRIVAMNILRKRAGVTPNYGWSDPANDFTGLQGVSGGKTTMSPTGAVTTGGGASGASGGSAVSPAMAQAMSGLSSGSSTLAEELAKKKKAYPV